MRKITRGVAPEALYSEDVRSAKNELLKFYQLSFEDRSRRRPPLNSKIWTSISVRENLSKVFYSKCAYCEVSLRYDSEHIDHFRPKGYAVNSLNKKSNQENSDHYSWLAYEWENLFLSCAECNRSKRNFFPIKGPRAWFRCTWSEAESYEQSLLINPCTLEPSKHLRFLRDGTVIGKSLIGRTTINVLSLNRLNLIHDRATKFTKCLAALEYGRKNGYIFDDIKYEMSDESSFCGSVRILFFECLKKLSGLTDLPKPSFRTIIDDVIRIATMASDEQWIIFNDCCYLAATEEEKSVLILDESEPYQEIIRPLKKSTTAQVRRILISDFKGISKLELNIPPVPFGEIGAPCMMLLGENSTGKSTTLQAISLALMGQRMRSRMGVLAEDFLPREILGWQLDDRLRPEITIEFDTNEKTRFWIDPLTKQFIGDDLPIGLIFAFGSRRFFGRDMVRRQQASTLKSLFDPFAKLEHPGRWLQELSNHMFDALARALREILILREEDSIERDNEGRLFVRAHGRDTPLDQLSDGYRSLMAMVLNVMRGMLEEWGDLENARGLVLIDEIETHLHPRWKLRVVSALRRAMPNVQFIATTHDPLCLRGMREGEVQVLVRDDNQQIQALEGLPDVRGLRAEQLLTSDYFGLSSTADPDVEGALNHLALHRAGSVSRDLEALRSFQWLGDTPFEQIYNEALRRFIAEAAASPEIDRSQVREAAVNDVLAGLHALRARHSS